MTKEKFFGNSFREIKKERLAMQAILREERKRKLDILHLCFYQWDRIIQRRLLDLGDALEGRENSMFQKILILLFGRSDFLWLKLGRQMGYRVRVVPPPMFPHGNCIAITRMKHITECVFSTHGGGLIQIHSSLYHLLRMKRGFLQVSA